MGACTRVRERVRAKTAREAVSLPLLHIVKIVVDSVVMNIHLSMTSVHFHANSLLFPSFLGLLGRRLVVDDHGQSRVDFF